MAAYFTSQGYDVPAATIWSILTDFRSWPRWFPNVSEIALENGVEPGRGAYLRALGDDPDVWTRWQIAEWSEAARLVCEHIESNAPIAGQVQAAYLQFDLADDAEGCMLEVELGAEGYGVVGDFFVGMTLGPGARRMLPRLVDAFSDHVVQRLSSST